MTSMDICDKNDPKTSFGGLLVHICRQAEWEQARELCSYHPPSLATAGFIHFSRLDQVLLTANRFYAAEPDLVLLWVPVKALQADLQWEETDGDCYPHLYRALQCSEVLAVTSLTPDETGVFRDLPEMPPKLSLNQYFD